MWVQLKIIAEIMISIVDSLTMTFEKVSSALNQPAGTLDILGNRRWKTYSSAYSEMSLG
jgi:hypothetical protein